MAQGGQAGQLAPATLVADCMMSFFRSVALPLLGAVVLMSQPFWMYLHHSHRRCGYACFIPQLLPFRMYLHHSHRRPSAVFNNAMYPWAALSSQLCPEAHNCALKHARGRFSVGCT